MAVASLAQDPSELCDMYAAVFAYKQWWGKLLLKVMFYNIALLPKK